MSVQPAAIGAAHNPFSSARVAPGAMPFLWSGGCAASVVLQMALAVRVVQIVGPHGSGKSTLLAHVMELAGSQGIDTQLARGRLSGQPPTGLVLLDEADSPGAAASNGSRLRHTLAGCRKYHCALVVATHRDLGLPTAWSMTPDAPTTARIVDTLLAGWPVDPPSNTILEDLMDRHQGNLRLVLFDLYDWFEAHHSDSFTF